MSFIDEIVGKILTRQASDNGSIGVMAPSPEASALTSAAPPTIPPVSPIDKEFVVKNMAAQHKEKLNWQTSIVDLLKVLNLDSSLAARKALAKELNYTGDTDDSATMNTWLIGAVMKRVNEAGNANSLRHDLRH